MTPKNVTMSDQCKSSIPTIDVNPEFAIKLEVEVVEDEEAVPTIEDDTDVDGDRNVLKISDVRTVRGQDEGGVGCCGSVPEGPEEEASAEEVEQFDDDLPLAVVRRRLRAARRRNRRSNPVLNLLAKQRKAFRRGKRKQKKEQKAALQSDDDFIVQDLETFGNVSGQGRESPRDGCVAESLINLRGEEIVRDVPCYPGGLDSLVQGAKCPECRDNKYGCIVGPGSTLCYRRYAVRLSHSKCAEGLWSCKCWPLASLPRTKAAELLRLFNVDGDSLGCHTAERLERIASFYASRLPNMPAIPLYCSYLVGEAMAQRKEEARGDVYDQKLDQLRELEKACELKAEKLKQLDEKIKDRLEILRQLKVDLVLSDDSDQSEVEEPVVCVDTD